MSRADIEFIQMRLTEILDEIKPDPEMPQAERLLAAVIYQVRFLADRVKELEDRIGRVSTQERT